MKIEMLENSAGFGKGGTYEVDRELGQRLADKGKARVLGDQSDLPRMGAATLPPEASVAEKALGKAARAYKTGAAETTQENAAEDSADITSDE